MLFAQHEAAPYSLMPALPIEIPSEVSLDTPLFPEKSKNAAVTEAQMELNAERPAGVLPFLRNLTENTLSDLKFAGKIVQRLLTLGTIACGYAQVPHIGLGLGLVAVTIAGFSDLCDKELRERHELRTEAAVAVDFIKVEREPTPKVAA